MSEAPKGPPRPSTPGAPARTPSQGGTQPAAAPRASGSRPALSQPTDAGAGGAGGAPRASGSRPALGQPAASGAPGAPRASGSHVPPAGQPVPTGRTPSNPGGIPRTTSGDAFKAQSAARMQPLKESAAAQSPLSARLKEGATDTALNVVGILRDLWSDFRSSDQFFKYKAGILAGWIALSVVGFVVACPGSGGPTNNIGARLVQGKVLDSTVISVVNDGDDAWDDVVVVVNKKFSSSVAHVPGRQQDPDNRFTVDPKKLRDQNNKAAPDDLQISDLYVRTANGRADLIEHGQKVE